MSRYVIAVAFCIVVPFMALAQVPAQGVIGGSSAGGGQPAVCGTGTTNNVMVIGAGPTCSQTNRLTVDGTRTTYTGILNNADNSSFIAAYDIGIISWFADNTHQDGFFTNLDTSRGWRLVKRHSNADATTIYAEKSTGNVAIGSVGSNYNPPSLFNVGNSAQFQVDSSGVLAKVRGATPTGTCTLNGSSPSTCTSTVAAGSICTCSPVGTAANIAAGGCAVSLSSTTLTITSANGHTNVVNWHCF